MIYNECFDKPEMFDAILAPAPGVDLGIADAPPLLTGEQERHLFRQMNFLLHRGEEAAALAIRNYIMRANVRLVYKMAKKAYGYVVGATGRWYEDCIDENVMDDLVGDGMLSLANAVEHFDYARGNRFSTYACTALRQNYTRTVPRQNREALTCVNNQPDWFDAAGDGDSEAAETLREEQRKAEVAELMKRLNQREQDVIRMRFTEELTLEQIGRQLGVTKERVRQIEARALTKLRAAAGA
jgi:RNA polymerase sigma factor (sigma-70 family)